MIKLYKRTASGEMHYHEAWAQDRKLIEHWGVVGTEGETKSHRRKRGEDEDAALERILAGARRAGFEEIAIDDHSVLLVEYPVDGFGDDGDLDKRHALEERLDQLLGWTGLGHCDGGSIGSGTMEACCYVVDFDIAARVVAGDLAETEFSDFVRIYDEDAD